jgi:heat-inducible transcriptional repressor
MTRKRELENMILAAVIREYVLTAQPVSSKAIVEKYIPGISPATVRNIMSDLERKGVLTHPFTSSGRIPTNSGYKYYVDVLMSLKEPDQELVSLIDEQIDQTPSDIEMLLNLTSRLLGTLTDEVGVAMTPVFMKGVVDDVQLIELHGDRLLLVFQIENGLIKTVMVETHHQLDKTSLSFIRSFFIELFVGYNLYSMKQKLDRYLSHMPVRERGLVELICNQIEQQMIPRIHTSRNFSFLVKPEFREPANSAVLQLLMTDGWMLRLRNMMMNRLITEGFTLFTGDDIDFVSGSNCSVIMSGFSMGNLDGTLAVVGPSRMDYDFIIPLLGVINRKMNDKMQKMTERE